MGNNITDSSPNIGNETDSFLFFSSNGENDPPQKYHFFYIKYVIFLYREAFG